MGGRWEEGRRRYAFRPRAARRLKENLVKEVAAWLGENEIVLCVYISPCVHSRDIDAKNILYPFHSPCIKQQVWLCASGCPSPTHSTP
jgi:hypothetical protein